jgi:leader peptidase (prepilin peptidase)/N-methyltransferase
MLVAICAVLGLLVGSYLGVVADRVPEGRTTSGGRSACDACGATLRLVRAGPGGVVVDPAGRCRKCRAPVSGVSTAMEVVTAGLFAALAAHFGSQWALGGFLVIAGGLVVLTVIELRTHTLPRRIIYATTVLALPFLIVGALREDEAVRLQWALYGSLGALLFFVVLYVGWRGSMGDGDVRLRRADRALPRVDRADARARRSVPRVPRRRGGRQRAGGPRLGGCQDEAGVRAVPGPRCRRHDLRRSSADQVLAPHVARGGSCA